MTSGSAPITPNTVGRAKDSRAQRPLVYRLPVARQGNPSGLGRALIALVDEHALTAHELAATTVGLRRADGGGRCWMKQKRWAGEAGMSPRTLGRVLASLERRGVIEVAQYVRPDHTRGVLVVTFVGHPGAQTTSRKRRMKGGTSDKPRTSGVTSRRERHDSESERQVPPVSPTEQSCLTDAAVSKISISEGPIGPVVATAEDIFERAVADLDPTSRQREEWLRAFRDEPVGFIRELSEAMRTGRRPAGLLTVRLRDSRHLAPVNSDGDNSLTAEQIWFQFGSGSDWMNDADAGPGQFAQPEEEER